MPSVASEISATQQSRFHQSHARSRSDATDRSQNSPFADLLDSAAPAAEPLPKPSNEPRNARTDKSDDARPADKGRQADTPADQNSPADTQDAGSTAGASSAKDTKPADADTTAQDAKTAGGSEAAEADTTAKAADTDTKTKPDGDLAAALQAMFADPAVSPSAPPPGTTAIAAPQPDVSADAPPSDAAGSGKAPQLDALAALQAAEQAAGPKAAASDEGQPAAADPAKGDGSDDIKGDAKTKKEVESDAKTGAKTDAKALTGAKAETAADAKTAAAQPQSDQDDDAGPVGGDKAADPGRHVPTRPVADNPEPETRSHHMADAAAAAKTSAAAMTATGATSTDVAAAATAGAAAPGAGAAHVQPQLPANANIQAQLHASIGTQAAVPLSGVAVEIASQASAGKQHFEIRLDPPELGRIDVKLDIDGDGNTTTRLVVERSETLDLLKRDSSQLERALQQAGLKTSDNGLEFSLRQQYAQNDDQSQSGAAKIVVPDEDATPLPVQRQSYGRLLGLSGGLDIRV